MKEIINNNFEQPKSKLEAVPTILGEYEHWKNIPPQIKIRKPLTLVEVAQKEGCELSKLESNIKNKVSQFAEAMKKISGYPSEEYVGLIDSLYNLYLQSKDQEIAKANPWLNSFSSYHDFAEFFCFKLLKRKYVEIHQYWDTAIRDFMYAEKSKG